MNDIFQYVNGELIELEAEEASECLAREEEWAANADTRIEHEVRQKRNRLLLNSDWAMLRAFESGEDSVRLREYRQNLRDLPEQDGFPNSVVWPTSICSDKEYTNKGATAPLRGRTQQDLR
jgi:hypothetical protein